MTHAEVALIDGFSVGERDASGRVVNWDHYWKETMIWVSRLRACVDSSCVLIRGDHNIGSGKPFNPDKQTAVDCYFPKAPFGRVIMELTRFPCSWGIYAGEQMGSVHMDVRKVQNGRLARWMGFHPRHEPLLMAAGLGSLVSGRSDGWIYLTWSSHLGVKAIYLMQQIIDDDPQGLLSPV